MKLYKSLAGIISGCLLLSCTQTEKSSTDVPSGINEQTLSIDVANVISEIQPTMYGVFFEDINFAADGGIYAEMVINRSFEFDAPLMGWTQPKSDRYSLNASSGFASIINTGYDKVNPHFMRVKLYAEQGYELQNDGFRGMGVKEGASYDFSLSARKNIGDGAKLTFRLIDSLGNELGASAVSVDSDDWKEYSGTLTVSKTVEKAKLNIVFAGNGEIDVDMISMFPKDTWMGRPRGMRKDLIQLLADLKPGFLRFPGGCVVEGADLSKRYDWKRTVGSIDTRKPLINHWNTSFDHKLTPDYFMSFGLGFFEYFQMAEDLGAEPLPILGCGMACQFKSAELVPLDQLDPYINDALDLIEFANGPITSKWGKVRADMGHPESFNMKYIGIGNEQWGPEYFERYLIFDAAIRAKYPDMQIVTSSGPFHEGEQFDYAYEQFKGMEVDLVDEHYYRSPEWFLENATRYDSYDRKGPKIFAGEYAAQSVATVSPDNKNNWLCAMSEAAFMTGLERNADIVHMTSYAPLFAHADAWQWTPDLIWFNNLESYGTANYYVQKMYSNNPGTHLLKVLSDGKPLTGQNKIYASAVKDEATGELIIKVVNASGQSVKTKFEVSGAGSLGSAANLEVLTNTDLEAYNTFEEPQKISPKKSEITVESGQLTIDLEPQSFTVIRVSI